MEQGGDLVVHGVAEDRADAQHDLVEMGVLAAGVGQHVLDERLVVAVGERAGAADGVVLGDRHRQRNVATRPVREDVGDVAGRAARHEDHAERDRPLHAEQQRQQERQRGQQRELCCHGHRERPGLAQRQPEVGEPRVHGDAEQDQSQDDLQRGEGPGVERDPDVVDVHEPAPGVCAESEPAASMRATSPVTAPRYALLLT